MSRINWSKALNDYLNDERLSYASIASKYSISLQAVKKKAGKEGWQDLRLEFKGLSVIEFSY